MWSTLLFAVLFCAVSFRNGSCDSDSFFGLYNAADGPELRRLQANAATILSLEKRLEVVREKLKKAEALDWGGKYHQITARLARLEGSRCKEHQFECGHGSGECVYELFVCDGRKDCSNGYDENDDVCSTAPAISGITYSGMIDWHSCAVRDSHPSRITMLAYRIRKYSPSLMWLKALIDAEYNTTDGKTVHISHPAFGHYKFATRQMVLFGEGIGKRLAAYCNFDLGEHRRTTCDLVQVSTLNKCATMHLALDES